MNSSDVRHKNRKDFEKVVGWIAEVAVAMAQSDLAEDLVPDMADVKSCVQDAADKLVPHVEALLAEAEQVRMEGEGQHPNNYFPDALKRAIRKRINAV